MDRRCFKKSGEELQQYLAFRKKGSKVNNKKGKGSYNRQKAKKEIEQKFPSYFFKKVLTISNQYDIIHTQRKTTYLKGEMNYEYAIKSK